MRKDDEAAFYALARANGQRGMTPRETLNAPECPVAFKRGCYLLGKWARRGWYEYGVALDMGWFTREAPGSL